VPCLQSCLRGRAVIVLNIQFIHIHCAVFALSWKNSHVVVQIQKERKVVLKENMMVAGVKARNKSKNAKPVSVILINGHYCHINVSAYLSHHSLARLSQLNGHFTRLSM